ncbi:MAG: hypothetical protein E6Q97_31615 [Desulfurellales bacterium]|nr:MAG: hypothetical protein E6Q97_31615 [Desulfurellales bacterium]
MTVLAFYKARGTIIDRAIRVVTRSPYSHVEILIGCDAAPEAPFSWPAFSASGRDGGVRTKLVTFDAGAWDFIAVPWAPAGRIRLAEETQCGLGYDWAGLILSQVFNLRRGSARRWFCSELVAWSLGLPIPSALSPGDLAEWADFLSKQHLQKEQHHAEPDFRAYDQSHRD